MTDSPGPDTGTTNTARRSHYESALAHLDAIRTSPTIDAMQTDAIVATAHAQMLLANEARVANLIAYAAVLAGNAGGAGLNPDGVAKLAELERRIDAALGTTVADAPRA